MSRRLMCLLLLLPALAAEARAESRPRLPVLPNEEAWRRLPGSPATAQPLPAWARMSAGPLPLTTARMLELDAMHRTGERLDGRFRAVVRWAAADANGSAYGRASAETDFARVGGDRAALPGLVKNPQRLPVVERLGVAFARKMMLEAHAVTDAEVKQLLDLLGEERVVALVALLAHASFQDRFLMALNAPPEPGGVPPPVTVLFGRPQPKPSAPPKAAPEPAVPAPGKNAGNDAGWVQLQTKLEKQKQRTSRIRVPPREEVLRRIGENHPAAWQSAIVWSRVCYGYQPELTDAWFDCAGAFRQESNLDRLFQNSIFWVVTESLQCFY